MKQSKQPIRAKIISPQTFKRINAYYGRHSRYRQERQYRQDQFNLNFFQLHTLGRRDQASYSQ